MPQVILEFLSFASFIKIPDECLSEFELIWNLSRLMDEEKRIENQHDSKSKGLDVSTHTNIKSSQKDIDTIYGIVCTHRNRKFDFPLFISALLKGPIDLKSKKKLMTKIVIRPELYKDALRIMTKDVFKCSRDQLPYYVFWYSNLSMFGVDQLENYNFYDLIRILFTQIPLAISRFFITLVSLFGISRCCGDIYITRHVILAAPIFALVSNIYYTARIIFDKYENFE